MAAAAAAVVAVGVPVLWSTSRGSTAARPRHPHGDDLPPLPHRLRADHCARPLRPDRPPLDGCTPTAPSSSVGHPADGYALDDTIRFGTTVLHLEKGTVVENLAVLANGGFVLQSHLSTVFLAERDGDPLPRWSHGPRPRCVGHYAVSPRRHAVLAKDGTGNTLVVYAPDGTGRRPRRDAREVGAIVGGTAYLGGGPSEGSLAWDVATGATRPLPAHVRRRLVSPDGSRAALSWMVTTDVQDEACWAVVDLRPVDLPHDHPEVRAPR